MKRTVTHKHKFATDFKSVLIFSLITNAKKLGKNDLRSVKECIGKKQMREALKIVERNYSPRQWKEYVEAQAQPLLKQLVKV